ncbi:MAG: oxidoreductase [Magnetospirillum sp.]|nr:oxidoreductase [Magnetospirillum sp.]
MSDFPILAWCGALLLLAGELAALANVRFVLRALILSTLAEAGYVLMGLGLGGAAGDTGAAMHLGYQAVMRGLVFLSALLLVRDVDSQALSALAGSARRRPWVTLLFGFSMFSVMGLSPFKGSYTKFLVLYAAIEQGHWALAAAGTIASIVAALYYMIVIQRICLEPGPATPARARPLGVGARAGLTLLAALTVAMSLAPLPFQHAAQWAVGSLEAAGLPDYETPWSALVLVPYAGGFVLWGLGRWRAGARDGLALLLAAATLALAWTAPGLDALSQLFVRLFAVVLAVVVVYSLGYMAGKPGANRYWFFLFLMAGSLLGVVTADHFASLYVFWELMTWTSYFLVVHERSREALRAGLKYFVMCTAGAYVLHFGILLAHAHLGSFQMAALAAQAPALPAGVAAALIATMMVGLAVKAALFPLHSWLPDAHPVAPSSISAPLSGVLTKAGLYGLLKLLFVLVGAGTLGQIAAAGPFSAFGLALSLAGAATLVLGEVKALREGETKRMLAYSTLAQVGEIAIVLGLGTGLGLTAALLHTVNHATMKSLAFLAAGALIFRLGAHRLDDLKGIGRVMPVTAGCLAVAALSLIGLPPFAGFVSKFLVVVACVEAGQWPLAVLVLAGGVLAAVYYARLVRLMFFAPYAGPEIREAPPAMLLPCLALAALVVVNGVLPGPSLALVAPAVAEMVARGGLAPPALPPLEMAWSAAAAIAAVGAVAAFLVGRRRPAWAIGLAVVIAVAAVGAVLVEAPRTDALGFWYALLVAGVGAVNLLHSTGYMAHEHARGRYAFLFLCMMAGLLGLAAAPDLFSFFAFWEVMSSWTLYFLIIHPESAESLREGFKYYLFNVVGASALFLGVAMLGVKAGWSFAGLDMGVAALPLPVLGAIVALLLLGLLMKAAMLPMRIDVQMHPATAPTPVSGYISAVLLKAGPWGVLKLFAILGGATLFARLGMVAGLSLPMEAVAVIAAVTTLYAGAMAVVQTGIKRLLIYSTVSQLAYVLLGLSLGGALGVAGGLFHAVNHMLLKDTLFLAAGCILCQAHVTSLDELGGLGKRMPVTFGLMLFAGLSLAGVPPLNGFASKWLIYVAAFQSGHPFLGLAALASSLFTLAAVLKFAHAAFLGQPSPLTATFHEPPPAMRAAMAVLVAASVALSLLPGLALVPIAHVQATLGLPAVDASWTGPLPAAAGWHPAVLAAALLALALPALAYLAAGRHRVSRTAIHTCGVGDLDPARTRVPASGLYPAPVRLIRALLGHGGTHHA